MSESSLIEIVASPIHTVRTSKERIRIMGERISVHMREISQNFSSLKLNESSIDCKNYQSLSPLLDKVKPISIKQCNATSILDTSKKLTATVLALSNSPELKELHSEVKLKLPYLESLANETNYFLKTGNTDALKVKTAEINTQFNKMLHVLQSRQRLMEREEIKTTSLLICDSLKEIGFDSIKEICIKDGSKVVRAVDRKSFTSVFAKINVKDGIRIDTKGFVGNECTRKVDALVDKLKEKGIEATKKDRAFHNKIEGGELVKAVEPLFNPLETASVPSRQDEAARLKKIQYMNKRERA